MNISELTNDEMSLWIAAYLGWRFEESASGSFWHHPDCVQPRGHAECGRSKIDFVNDSRMTLALFVSVCSKDYWAGQHAIWERYFGGYPINEDKWKRAVAEAFMLKSGWTAK